MHIMNSFLHLCETEFVLLNIQQKLWQIVKLGDQFSYIGYLSSYTMPADPYGAEESITEIEFSAL